MTWEQLVELEPGLAVLEREIKALRSVKRSRFCANHAWYDYSGQRAGYKQRLLQLVGWDARRPELQDHGVYDVAYHHLYDLLPPCRGCGCF